MDGYPVRCDPWNGNAMKLLILGCKGQLGWELQRSLAPLGQVVALERDASSNVDGLCGDLSQPDALAETVRRVAPHVIVNAAAYTAVDKAESDVETAMRVNAAAPAVLARVAADLGAWIVHYSTDYVFDGSSDLPWKEDDTTGPLSVYGASKLAGEEGVRASLQHVILRTSWVYGARGGNFARTMLRLAATRETLQVVNDQFGAPTGADLLADITAHIVRSAVHSETKGAALAGTYHAAADGCTTWFDYANYAIAQARIAHPALKIVAKEVLPVPSSQFPVAARRPHNSRLDTRKLRETFGLHLPPWQQGVARMISEMDHVPNP